MAALETIRVKFGVVITVLIAVALLSFIIDPTTLQSVSSSMSSKYDVGEIDGKSISYTDYQADVEKFTAINEVMTGASAEHTVFGVLANGAGVKQDKVGFFGFFGKIEAHFLKHTLHAFGVANVLLTSVGMNKGTGFTRKFIIKQSCRFFAVFPLTGNFLRRYGYRFRQSYMLLTYFFNYGDNLLGGVNNRRRSVLDELRFWAKSPRYADRINPAIAGGFHIYA